MTREGELISIEASLSFILVVTCDPKQKYVTQKIEFWIRWQALSCVGGSASHPRSAVPLVCIELSQVHQPRTVYVCTM